MARVVVVDDEAGAPSTFRHLLGNTHSVFHYPRGALVVDFVREQMPDLVVVSLDMKDAHGTEIIRALSALPDAPPLLALCRAVRPRAIVDAVRAGAHDVLSVPLAREELRETVARALAAAAPARTFVEPDPMQDLVGSSDRMRRLRAEIGRFAGSPAPVLITGESGVGKELVASALHRAGPRRLGPFVARNCGAIPEQLFESEMFGTERGAYTGAVPRPGAFGQAQAGTLFLDEVGELPAFAQVKLLRALENGYHRVGGSREIRPDVRFIAATHRNLRREMEAGRFREDLYYRINVLQIHVPPLRERPEDIPLLVRHFAQRLGAAGGGAFASDALVRLSGHSWPGNVRELRNVVDRALTRADETPIRSCDISFG
jgi:DNA-binding NtrC family response regulator